MLTINPNLVYIVFDGTSHYPIYGMDYEDEVMENDVELVAGPYNDWTDEVDNKVDELNEEAYR